MTRHVGLAGQDRGFSGYFSSIGIQSRIIRAFGNELIASVLFFSKGDIVAFVDQNTLQRHVKPFSSTPRILYMSVYTAQFRTREHFTRQQRLWVYILKRTTALSAEWRSGSAVSDIQPLADYTNKIHSRAHRHLHTIPGGRRIETFFSYYSFFFALLASCYDNFVQSPLFLRFL